MADLCEGVRILTHAITFLAKVPVGEEKSVKEYLTNTLLLDNERLTIIPKSAQIKHLLALYLHLSWHRAVEFAKQGIDSYSEIVPEAKDIPEETVCQLRSLLQRMYNMRRDSVTFLQQRLNEILISMVHKEPKWSLTEDIFPYFDFMDDKIQDDESWYEGLPSKIQFCHINHLFRLTVCDKRGIYTAVSKTVT